MRFALNKARGRPERPEHVCRLTGALRSMLGPFPPGVPVQGYLDRTGLSCAFPVVKIARRIYPVVK